MSKKLTFLEKMLMSKSFADRKGAQTQRRIERNSTPVKKAAR